MKYRYKLTFHLVGGEVLVSENVSEEKTPSLEDSVGLLFKMNSVTETFNNGNTVRGINMSNVLYVNLEFEEIE